MIAALICNENRNESILIGDDCKEQVAILCNETLNLSLLPDDCALEKTAREEASVNLLYYDFQDSTQTDGLRLLKKQNRDAMVMLIADTTVSPLDYLRPGIAPDALLLRPIRKAQLRETNREFFQSFLDRVRTEDVLESFSVVTREETFVVPYSQIFYFEAREKKLYLRTQHEEYAFYGTIDNLEKTLPASFCRCHRSYIVNIKKLSRVDTIENYLELAGRLSVPLSRSYKKILKENLL